MTEAYFGMNDFFPFNRAELMTAEPELYELLRSIWEPETPADAGKTPVPAAGASPAAAQPAASDPATVLYYAQPAEKWSAALNLGWEVPGLFDVAVQVRDLYRVGSPQVPAVGVKLNGQTADASPCDDGYVHLQRRWQFGDLRAGLRHQLFRRYSGLWWGGVRKRFPDSATKRSGKT